MSAERWFFDTNILVYLFDAKAPAKQAAAQALWDSVCRNGTPVISTQVLQEFFVTVTKTVKQDLPVPLAREAVIQFAAAAEVMTISVELIEAAAHRMEISGFSFWDSLIVETAIASGAQRLCTEDLQSGQLIGRLEIRNPFAAVSDI